MAAEATPLLYSTKAEVEYVFSSLGVDLRLDDDDTGEISATETTYMDEILVEATDIANESLLHFYDSVDLETSRWVRRRVSYIAAHLLSRRCGNPAQYSDEYEKALADFERIRTGRNFIPRLNTTDDPSPTVSNQIVDYRYSRAKLRTDPVTSDENQGRPVDYPPALDYWPYY